MKKISGSLFLTLLSVSFASAADRLSEGLSKGMNQVLDIIKSFLGPFFSAILGGTGDVLFQKILFLVIILLTVQLIVKNMPVFKGDGNKNNVVIWIISVSISLLATRFMTVDLLKTMLLPYTTLGVVLTSAIPLLIFFAFVQGQNRTIRKICWVLFGVTFLVIWSSRAADVGAISWIYFGTAMVSFFFLLFDGTIKRLMIKAKSEELDKDHRAIYVAEMKERLDKMRGLKNSGNLGEDEFKRIERKLMSEIRKAATA